MATSGESNPRSHEFLILKYVATTAAQIVLYPEHQQVSTFSLILLGLVVSEIDPHDPRSRVRFLLLHDFLKDRTIAS